MGKNKKRTKCRISLYCVIVNKNTIHYGFRCGPHGILTRRYSSDELRAERIAEHKKSAKKS